MLNKANIGYAYHKLIFDKNKIPMDFIFLEINDVLEGIIGLEKKDLINTRVTESLKNLKINREQWWDLYQNIIFQEKIEKQEKKFEINDKCYTVYIEAIDQEYFSILFIDVTKDKLAQEELENFFNVNLDLLCIADLNGNFLKVNRAWEEILGYKKSDLEDKKFLNFIHPDDIEKTLEAMGRLGENNKVVDFVNRYRAKNGNYRYIEWRSHPKGNYIYAAARDITGRIKGEAKLKEKNEQFKSLVNNIPGVTYRCRNDKNYTMIYISRDIVEISGYTPEELLDKIVSYQDIIYYDDRDKVRMAIDLAIKSGNQWEIEYRIKRKTGEIVWVRENGRAQKNKNEKVESFDGFILDINEKEKIRKAFEKSKEKLEMFFEQSFSGFFFMM
jgi:PAS domain S-box-containing protein